MKISKVKKRRVIGVLSLLLILILPTIFTIIFSEDEAIDRIPEEFNFIETELEHWDSNLSLEIDKNDGTRTVDGTVTFAYKDEMISFVRVHEPSDSGLWDNQRILVRLIDNERQSGLVRIPFSDIGVSLPSAVEFQDRLYILYRTKGWSYNLISYNGTHWEGPFGVLNGSSHGYESSMIVYQDKIFVLWRSGPRTGVNYQWFDGSEFGPEGFVEWNFFDGPIPFDSEYFKGINPMVHNDLLVLPMIKNLHAREPGNHLHLLYTTHNGETWTEPVKRYIDFNQGEFLGNELFITPIKDGVVFSYGEQDNENETYTFHVEIVKNGISSWKNITYPWGDPVYGGCVIEMGVHFDPMVYSYKDGFMFFCGMDDQNRSLYYYDGRVWTNSTEQINISSIHEVREVNGEVFIIERYPWRLKKVDPEKLNVEEIELPFSCNGIIVTSETIIIGTDPLVDFYTYYRFNGTGWDLIGTIPKND